MKQVLLFIGLMTIFTSCFEQGDCSDVSTNVLKIGFYNFGDRRQRTIVLDSIKIEGSSQMLYKGTSAASIELPLNPEAETIIYHLYFGNSKTDLTIDYNVKAFVLAPDCAAIDLYSINDATGLTINEIFFTQKTIAKDVPENIKLFF